MTHRPPGMAVMEYVSKDLGQIVAAIDNAWNMAKNDIAFLTPLLDGKVLNLDMSSTRSGT